MKQQLVTHADILALWSRASDLATDLNVPYGRAHKWKQRKFIAPAYWDDLIVAASQRFDILLTYQQLQRGLNLVRGRKKVVDVVKKRAA